MKDSNYISKILSRFDLISFAIFVFLWGLFSRIAINMYLTYDFYRKNYSSIGDYLKSLLTAESFKLWWNFLLSSKLNISLILLTFAPAIFLGLFLFAYDLNEKCLQKKKKDKTVTHKTTTKKENTKKGNATGLIKKGQKNKNITKKLKWTAKAVGFRNMGGVEQPKP